MTTHARRERRSDRELFTEWSTGSRWMRWDPHIHSPGTLRNNQFRQDWDGYLRAIDDAEPGVAALGVTDYFSLRGYKEVLRRHQAGAIPSVKLIFANVELRLTIETKNRQGINIHLLLCPDDPNHIARFEEQLARLCFKYRGENYPCSDSGLCRLGKTHVGDARIPDEAALQEGANQFKIEHSELRKLLEDDAWLRENVLVAVSGGDDGLSGLSKDAGFHALREELGRFADIVFSGSPQQRAFWLESPSSADDIKKPKPCLHGSDAHRIDDVLKPSLGRNCWIRAEPTFDGLRQVLVEPGRRTHLGEEPPASPDASHVIRVLRFRGGDWVSNQEISLNDGLVTIVGAKGSGKTALADMIAVAADADEGEPGPASFIAKAGSLLDGLELELEWGDGSIQHASFPRDSYTTREPRVRYLSQQFVEQLCSHAGLSDSLVEEIERVVFGSLPEESRLRCSTFSELREFTLRIALSRRDAEREAITSKTFFAVQDSGIGARMRSS
jgi:hypothetical protein